ncbi:MAG: hypothetical protein ABEJ66_00070, partial [Candidatus Nanohaloarchaea archaeon]
MEAFELGENELRDLLLAVVTVGAGLAAFSGTTSALPALEWLGVALAVVAARELGQRAVAQ